MSFGFLVFILLASIVGAVVRYYYQKYIGSKLEMFKLENINAQTNLEVVRDTLRKMICTYAWTKEGESNVCHFDYQGAHFSIELTDNDPFTQLSLYYIHLVSLEYINVVRAVCNKYSSTKNPFKVVYSVNQEHHGAAIHIMSSLLLNEVNAHELLTKVMAQMFEMRRLVVAEIESETQKARSVDCADYEVATVEWGGELELLHELEIDRQPAVFSHHEAAAHPVITPRALLATMFGITDSHIDSLSAWTNDETHIHMGEDDDIANFPLSALLIADGKFVHSWVGVELTYHDDSGDGVSHNLGIHLDSEMTTPSVLYYRVTLTLMPVFVPPVVSPVLLPKPGDCHTFVAGYELVPTKQQTDAINYQWHEAREKFKSGGESQLTATQRVLAHCEQPDLAQYIYLGRQRYLERRFFDALSPLGAAYERYAARYDQMGADERRSYYEVCYLLGSCYYHLRRFEIAHFYLFQTLSINNLVYTMQYVNCMVSMGNCDALRFIDSSLANLKRSMDMGSLNSNCLNFYYFLQRRKVEFLLNAHRVDEAEQLLRTMLDGNPNSDFAIERLAEIQKEKEKL